MVGEPDQIPPVQGYTLWFKNAKNQDDVNYHHLLLLFHTVVELEENTILYQNDSHAVELYDFLQRLSDRTNAEADWNLLHQKCLKYAK